METLVPGQLPRSALWTATLLLWLGTGALGISEQNLHAIIKHMQPNSVHAQFAFALSLEKRDCDNPSRLGEVLPADEVQKMRNAMNLQDRLYNEGNIVAARVNRLQSGAGQHAEWRLLQGGQTSLVQELLRRTQGSARCLIFFTLNSPCVNTCLQQNGCFNIIQMVKDTFSSIDNNYKAFVFQNIHREDKDCQNPENLLQAWHQLTEVSLWHCNNRCQNCDSNNRQTNPCLAGMGARV